MKKIFKEICLAVEHLHQNNIAHRDIKTENVLVNSKLEIKLIDFGFAREMKHKEDLISVKSVVIWSDLLGVCWDTVLPEPGSNSTQAV